jgi:hypothetical protein
MEKPRTTPKDFFLWAGAMISLYWSVVAFIFLIFDYINFAMPNPLSYYPADPYQSSIPYDMASIIVLFPIYLALMWIIRRDIAKDPTRSEVWIRRWALIFTLFVAGVTAAVDLIVLLTTFLRGEELTLAFLLKVLVVLLVSAGAFMHFIADMWGYWTQYPSRKHLVGIGVSILAVVSIIAGFFIVGTPQQARLYRFDDQKVSDLQNIQYQVVSYYQQKQKLPATLADLADPISNTNTPTDPQSGAQYEYAAAPSVLPPDPITGKPYPAPAPQFELCAQFNKPTRTNRGLQNEVSSPVMPTSYGLKGSDNWQHAGGKVCFDRTIDPQRYPPATTPGIPAKGI